LREQDLARMGGDAEPGQHQREMLAQRQITEWAPVFEQVGRR
jgi:hypothetical protein